MEKSNPNLLATIAALKEHSRTAGVDIWRDVALRLEKASSRWAEVNVSRVDRHVGEGETALVPGKLLAAGKLSKRVDVAAFRFSEQARQKIQQAGGRCWSLEDLARDNPKGQKVRIIG